MEASHCEATMASEAIVRIEETENQNQALTPMGMIEIAIRQNADIDKLEKLLSLQQRWEANEARKAFEEAMGAFKAETIVILKDKTNPQYNSKYVSLGTLIATVTPFLSKHGLSATWEIDQSQGIKVSCVITHRQGHSKVCSLIVPPDKSGSKNPIQEIKSAITYARACTFESACGLAASDANLDDDGNGAGSRMDDLSERIEWIQNCRNAEELKTVFAAAYQKAKAADDRNAMQALIKVKDLKKKDLQ